MTVQGPYTSDYFDALRDGARRSAEVVVPLLLRLTRPASVVDVGCGRGTWLAVFREHGVEDAWGVDGDYVDSARLEIPRDRFLAHDLARPLHMDRTFDLAVSLEVAEHLHVDCADEFVNSLTRLAPLVLFSAAAPHQGGVHHVNEQWPAYWARRFAARGFVPIDCLRRQVWEDDRVEWWYAQNMLLYADRSALDTRPLLKQLFEQSAGTAPSFVHPRRYLEWVGWGLDQCLRLHTLEGGAG